ncbi:related to HMG-box transcription factor [Ustilago sp. UG-2017b]|nr:related to HMG-box transcription factor [Ustilago sp. UG-2017b]
MLLLTPCLAQIPRGTSSLHSSMAQQGYGIGSGPSRTGQYDDRGAGQARQGYSDLTSGVSQSETFGRCAPLLDGSSLLPSLTSSYDHTSTSSRADASSNSLLHSMHSQSASDSQALSQYGDALSHPQLHYSDEAQSSSHASQSSQPYQEHQHHQQGQHYRYQQHNYHPHHLHHPSEQQQYSLGMQMGGDLVGSQPMGMHHATAQYGFHPHSPRQFHFSQGLSDAQRKDSGRAEAAEPHTPRPPNAWILYRSEKFREIQQSRNERSRSGSSEKPKSQAEISKMISQMWQNETSVVKQKFEALADEKKLAHQRMYPTYRYRPKKKGKTAKQAAASQNSDRSPSDGHSPSKKETDGSFSGGYQERYSPRGNASSAYIADRKSGAETHRVTNNQSPSSMHNQVGRDLIARKTNYGNRRERGDLQAPIHYGRSVSGSTSSSEGHSVASYSNNRMHPYSDRPTSFMKQESPRQSNLFDDTQSNASSSYAGSHWPGPDAMAGGSSGSTYFNGSRGYTNFNSTRMPAPQMMGSGSAGSASLILSPISPPQRQLVPSQQLPHPMDGMDGNSMNLAELTNAGSATSGYGNNGSSFRTAPVNTYTGRFGPSPNFGDASRSELPTGLAVPGSNDGLSDNFDPHRRM